MDVATFSTLADPMRLRIVEALRGGERAVSELVERVEIQQSGVSRHLRILHDAGFVSVRPEGTKRYYALRPEPFRELDAWVSRFRQTWESRLDRFDAELQRRKRARSDREKGKSS